MQVKITNGVEKLRSPLLKKLNHQKTHCYDIKFHFFTQHKNINLKWFTISNAIHSLANLIYAYRKIERKNLNLDQKIAQKKERWKKQETDDWQMVEANTLAMLTFSPTLLILMAEGVFIHNPKIKLWNKWFHESVLEIFVTYCFSLTCCRS